MRNERFFYPPKPPGEAIDDTRDARRVETVLRVAGKVQNACETKREQSRVFADNGEETLDVKRERESKEGFYIGRECEDWEMDLPLRGKNVWLTKTKEEDKEEGEEASEARKIGIRFRLAMERYYEEMVQFCDGFVPTFAEALGLPGFFEDKFKPHNALLRPLKYGKVKSEGKQFAMRSAFDYGVLTMLWVQPGSEGLEIFDEKSESWMQVNLGGAEDEGKERERPDDFICNIGDLMQFWTNDRFKSTVHRVVTDGTKERYSAAFFYEPSYECEIEPIVLEGEEPKYEKTTFLKYILAKYDATHKGFDSGEKNARRLEEVTRCTSRGYISYVYNNSSNGLFLQQHDVYNISKAEPLAVRTIL